MLSLLGLVLCLLGLVLGRLGLVLGLVVGEVALGFTCGEGLFVEDLGLEGLGFKFGLGLLEGL